jgi:hypothetical protein
MAQKDQLREDTGTIMVPIFIIRTVAHHRGTDPLQ